MVDEQFSADEVDLDEGIPLFPVIVAGANVETSQSLIPVCADCQ